VYVCTCVCVAAERRERLSLVVPQVAYEDMEEAELEEFATEIAQEHQGGVKACILHSRRDVLSDSCACPACFRGWCFVVAVIVPFFTARPARLNKHGSTGDVPEQNEGTRGVRL